SPPPPPPPRRGPPAPPPTPPQVIFFGDFTHQLVGTQRPKEGDEVDEVKFREAVVVKAFQVVPAGESPNSVSLPSFKSTTQLQPFQIEVFCKDLNNVQTAYFDRLVPKTQVSGGLFLTLSQEIVTNHLVIRGTYQGMSVVVSGAVVPRASLSPAALQVVTAAERATAAPQPPAPA
ncbi:unnamed protein product, partial [Discosporangium mesarthrocarpum]